LTTSARIALFGVLSGLVWSAAPICFLGTRPLGVFLFYVIAGVLTGLLVSLALYKPLARFGRFGVIPLGIFALPFGAFCFGFIFALLGMAAGDLAGRVTWASPFYSGLFFAYMTAVTACLSWWGLILLPSALLTTYLFRLTIVRRNASRGPA
jgi:hypothetical protein